MASCLQGREGRPDCLHTYKRILSLESALVSSVSSLSSVTLRLIATNYTRVFSLALSSILATRFSLLTPEPLRCAIIFSFRNTACPLGTQGIQPVLYLRSDCPPSTQQHQHQPTNPPTHPHTLTHTIDTAGSVSTPQTATVASHSTFVPLIAPPTSSSLTPRPSAFFKIPQICPRTKISWSSFPARQADQAMRKYIRNRNRKMSKSKARRAKIATRRPDILFRAMEVVLGRGRKERGGATRRRLTQGFSRS